MQVKDALNFAQEKLTKVSEDAHLEAEILLSFILKTSREKLWITPERALTTEQLEAYNELITQRVNNIPISIVLGSKDFWKNTFEVNDQVLTPRPDTELLLKEVIETISTNNYPTTLNCLDLCTGSGAIGISLIEELITVAPKKNTRTYQVILSDISEAALKICRQNFRKISKPTLLNFRKNNPDKNLTVEIVHSDLFDNLPRDFKQNLQVIVCNPPYLPLSQEASDAPELKNEPRIALYSGYDGLRAYRSILTNLKYWLDPTNGFFCGEIHPENLPELKEICAKNGLAITKVLPGLGNEDRFIVVRPL